MVTGLIWKLSIMVFKSDEVLNEWRSAVIVLLYKVKRERTIKLVKIFALILVDSHRMIEGLTDDAQVCLDQIGGV